LDNNQIEALVKLRDSLSMAAEALNDYINTLAPKEEKKPTFDAEKLPWETIPAPDNPKGPWQKTLKSEDPNFIALADWIRDKGKTVKYQGSSMYWILNDGAIGRRIKKADH